MININIISIFSTNDDNVGCGSITLLLLIVQEGGGGPGCGGAEGFAAVRAGQEVHPGPAPHHSRPPGSPELVWSQRDRLQDSPRLPDIPDQSGQLP